MSSFLIPPPASVKVCSYCYSQHTMDVAGFNSLRMDAWFCHKYCHNLALLTSGKTKQSDNPEYYKHLIESRKIVFPIFPNQEHNDTAIERNRKMLRHDLRNKQIKIVKQIYEQPEPEEIEVEREMN